MISATLGRILSKGGRSIFLRSAMLSAIVALITITTFVSGIIPHQRKLLASHIEERALILAASLERVTPAFVAEDYDEVIDECLKMVRSSNHVLYAVVTRRKDGFSIVTRNNQEGQPIWEDATLDGLWKPGTVAASGEMLYSDLVGEDVLHYTYPIEYKKVPYGWVHVGLSLEDFATHTQRVASIVIALAVPSLLLGVGVSFMFSRRLTKPISVLREFALGVATGNLDDRVDVRSKDEVGLLAATMNQMTSDLKRSREEIAEAARQEAKLQDTLLKEIHHRVKNNMQILSSMMRMQRRTTAADEIKNVLIDGEARIRSMGLIHEKLYQSKLTSKVNLGSYLETLIGQLLSLLGADKSKLTLETDCDEVMLGLDTALPCGLIANEIVSNSIKYAFKGKEHGLLKIVLRKMDDGYEMMIGDDGIGLPPEDQRRKGSLGMNLISMLVDQLDGRLEIVSAPDEGTRFHFTFKESQYASRM